MKTTLTLLALVAGLALPLAPSAQAATNPPPQRNQHDGSVQPRHHHHRGFDGYGEHWSRYGDRIVRAADPTDPRD